MIFLTTVVASLDKTFTAAGGSGLDMVPGRDTALLPSARAALRRRLGIDARALAAFRIAVGSLLVVDLLYRSRNLVVFYTDGGVLPRAASAELYPTLSALSIHGLSGAAWLQWLLFAVGGTLAVLLTVGYRTRITAAGSWVLLASLQFRNYVVLNGGDTVLLVALFLALFLPLGERWSLDAVADRREGRPRSRVAGFASAALLSQVTLIYATNAVFKLRSDAWTNGTAVRYVFAVDRFTVRFGDLLAEVPALLVAVNWTWLAMLVASPLLVVATGRARTALVAAFGTAHLGMWLTMDLGLFPHAMVACLLLFVPPSVWDRTERAVAPVERSLRARVGNSPFVHSGPLLPLGVRDVAARLAPAVTATVLVVGLLWQGVAVGYVAAPAETPVDPAEHSWKLFAPHPPTADGWFVVTGGLSSGATVDLYLHANTSDGPPADSAATYPTTRWRKYLTEVRRDPLVRRYFADYLCRWGEDRYGERVETVDIEYVTESVRFEGPTPTERRRLGRYRCPVVD